jgi:hypothetical protein
MYYSRVITCSCGKAAKHEVRSKNDPKTLVCVCHDCFDNMVNNDRLLPITDWPVE